MKSVISDQLSVVGKKPRVALGLSGGVDSSVSAALLIDQGYDVTGVFLTCWDENRPGCRIDQDRKDALDIALQLKIPFVALDFKKEYKEKVIDYFYREYQAGRTPNPDTMCNREIKFGMFYDWALRPAKGKPARFDFVATGHYARVVNGREILNSNNQILNKFKTPNFNISKSSLTHQLINSSTHFLQRGIDSKKDQSYFLYQLRPEQLPHILFPIGHLTKDQVRVEANKRGLKTASKPDSQGICFIGEINVGDFLREKIEEKEGEVVMRRKVDQLISELVNQKERKSVVSEDELTNQPINQLTYNHHVPIGTHRGVPFYTIGQKLGKEIDQALVAKLCKQGVLDFDPTAMPPLFVIAKDLETNTLLVGTEAQTYRDEFEVIEVNWFPPKADQLRAEISELVNWEQVLSNQLINKLTSQPINIFIRIRHGGQLVRAELVSADDDQIGKLIVKPTKPIKGVAPGQACVFYSDDSAEAVVLGGGVIL